ncbi:MAG: PhnD/SsuA/transferrin family substrate-binding protein [Deltaproteobacteria bacterium]|nr:PhnD/SsuA/transferrin family substrate-binding protein [Deltaproteobacteria bacterium]
MNRHKSTVTHFLALALLCFLIWCSPSHSETFPKNSSNGVETIVFGYTPQIFYQVDKRDAIELMDAWARISERKLNHSIKISTVMYRTLADAENAVAKKEVDLLVMIPEELLSLRSHADLESVLSADFGNTVYNNLLLLVREGSSTQIEQLRGKSLIIDMGQKGTIPLKWLESLLKTEGLPNSGLFLGHMTESSNGSQALMPVFFGKADACLVERNHYETSVELNPQIAQRLHILARSPGFVTGIISVRKGVSKTVRDKVVKVLQEMHTDPRGKQIMTLFRINRLVPFLPEHLTSVKKLLPPITVKRAIAAQRKQ